MSRPSDYVDTHNSQSAETESVDNSKPGKTAQNIELGLVGWLRWGWRQLTSMRTAMLLLLLLALAAIPGSLFPQRTADPNGVVVYYSENPKLAEVLNVLQLFDVYSSVWFSAIYLLLFVSLIGCILPRTKHHLKALRSEPPKTPVRLNRLPGYTKREILAADASDAQNIADLELQLALKQLKQQRYRVRELAEAKSKSLSAERGYWRETGNLIFHVSLLGVLVSVAIGGFFGYQGQRLLVQGQTFANTLSAYDSFTPGRGFSDSALAPYALKLEEMLVSYETENPNSMGIVLDYTAKVSTRLIGQNSNSGQIKVNHPINIGGTDVYLLGNGYAPTITVKNPAGEVVFQDSVPFLAQDKNNTSNGVIKIPDGLAEQVGLLGFFYPTVAEMESGAYTSIFPDLVNPLLTLNVYVGDLGIDDGIPKSVYVLDTDQMTQVAGSNSELAALELSPGQTVQLPNGLGSVTLDAVPRFASLDIHHDPGQVWVLGFALAAFAGLITSLFIPRRRMWVRAKTEENLVIVEYAGLARGEDMGLEQAVEDFVITHSER